MEPLEANHWSSLTDLGWDGFFESYRRRSLEESPELSRAPARVIGEERGLFHLANPNGTFFGVIAGKLRYLAEERLDLPAVGDWVLCSREPNAERAIIHAIFPRRTCIKRKEAGRGTEDQILAANVDCALIVTSANTEFNPARLQRYATAVRNGGVEVEIVLSKIDLCPDHESLFARIQSAMPGIVVHAISVRSSSGLAELHERLTPGRTFVFLGSSGVGKSTLLNGLMGHEVMTTQTISGFEDKGRHTTSSRHLFALPSGSLVIDTPGLREFRLGDFEQGLKETYEDIVALSDECKFYDCHHQGEPGCAVEQAREDGSLSEERWNWFVKLQKEVEYQKRRDSGEHGRNTKARWKKIHQQASQYMKRKRWES